MLLARDLPNQIRHDDPETIYNAMRTDKKQRNGQLRFVVPAAIGEMIFVDDPPKDLVVRAIRRVCHPARRSEST